MDEGMDLGWGGCLKSPQIHCYQRRAPFRLCLCFIPPQNEPGSINGGEPVICVQTALPLPGAGDYFLMISAHLDTVFCFTSLACVETMGPRGELSSVLKHWGAVFVFALALVSVSPWTYGILAH